MATTFTEAKAALDEIAERITNSRKRRDQARITLGAAQSELAGLASAYSQFITDLNAAATADTWPLADAQKAELDQLTADFQALKSEVDAQITAFDGA